MTFFFSNADLFKTSFNTFGHILTWYLLTDTALDNIIVFHYIYYQVNLFSCYYGIIFQQNNATQYGSCRLYHGSFILCAFPTDQFTLILKMTITNRFEHTSFFSNNLIAVNIFISYLPCSKLFLSP